jgi:hypothetical protein
VALVPDVPEVDELPVPAVPVVDPLLDIPDAEREPVLISAFVRTYWLLLDALVAPMLPDVLVPDVPVVPLVLVDPLAPRLSADRRQPTTVMFLPLDDLSLSEPHCEPLWPVCEVPCVPGAWGDWVVWAETPIRPATAMAPHVAMNVRVISRSLLVSLPS